MTSDRHPPTILDCLEAQAQATPDKTAAVFAGETLTIARMWFEIERMASFLSDRSLAPAARVVIVFPNELGFFGAFFGVQRAGGVAVPLYPDSGADRVADIADQCGASLVLVSSLVPITQLNQIRDLCESPGRAVVSASESRDHRPRRNPFEPKSETLAYLQYTSGSTGNPKGVEITHGNIVANARQMTARWEITPHDVFVSWLPMWHDMGLILMTMAPLIHGAKLVLMPTSVASIRRWMAVIAEHRGTFTAAPDFAYRIALRSAPPRNELDLSCLRFALSAAEPVRSRTIAEFEAHFGLGPTLVPAYGLAEGTAGVTGKSPHAAVKTDRRGLVSAGSPLPDIELEIIGDEGPAKAGEIGEIVFKSPAATRGYFRNPEATAKLRTTTGAIRTGDLGYLDDDGELFIVGRKKSIIIQAGRTIAPQEIEETVDRLGFVRRSAAVGIDRGGLEGEQAWVFVELWPDDPSNTGDHAGMVVEIVQAVRNRLGLRPGRVYLLEPRSVPTTHNGKVQHLKLRRRYLDGTLRKTGRIIYPEH